MVVPNHITMLEAPEGSRCPLVLSILVVLKGFGGFFEAFWKGLQGFLKGFGFWKILEGFC